MQKSVGNPTVAVHGLHDQQQPTSSLYLRVQLTVMIRASRKGR